MLNFQNGEAIFDLVRSAPSLFHSLSEPPKYTAGHHPLNLEESSMYCIAVSATASLCNPVLVLHAVF